MTPVSLAPPTSIRATAVWKVEVYDSHGEVQGSQSMRIRWRRVWLALVSVIGSIGSQPKNVFGRACKRKAGPTLRAGSCHVTLGDPGSAISSQLQAVSEAA